MISIKRKEFTATPLVNSPGKNKQRILPKYTDLEGNRKKDYFHAVRAFAESTTSPESMNFAQKMYYGLKGMGRKTVWIQINDSTYCKASESSLTKRCGEAILAKKNQHGIISQTDITSLLTHFATERNLFFTYIDAMTKCRDVDNQLNNVTNFLNFVETLQDPVLKSQFTQFDYYVTPRDFLNAQLTGGVPEVQIPSQAFQELKELLASDLCLAPIGYHATSMKSRMQTLED